MMFQIGTRALAERLYTVWKERQDFVEPVIESETLLNASCRWVSTRRSRPRPKWAALDSVQQDVWRKVAEAAVRVMADAIGALP